MYKYVKKTKIIRGYMESLALYIFVPVLYWEDRTSFISVVEAKIFIPRVKDIDILVYFILEQFDNGLFIAKY